MTTIHDIYKYIDSIAPYDRQEGYDNSGVNVCTDSEIKRVLLALDVTNDVADEAASKGVQLVLTHHPVIFHGLKTLDGRNPAVRLVTHGIGALSAHTNFDSARLNDVLCEKIGITPKEPLAVENGTPFGYVCDCEPISAPKLAKKIRTALGCTVVRYNDEGREIKRIAVCSGSGGSFLNDALSKKADCLITGDVKHDVFTDAHNLGFTVFDAGHFHTENIFCEYMQGLLSKEFPSVEFVVAEASRDILSYELRR